MRRKPQDTSTLDLFAWSVQRANALPPQTFRLLDPAKVEQRPYLDIARHAWRNRESIGIVADTSTGKTYIALALADAILAEGRRLLISAPTNTLGAQHADLARALFRIPPEDVVHLHARMSPRKRAAAWAAGKISVGTPHVFANGIAAGAPVLDRVGLVVLDEAHHAAKRYPAIAIAAAARAAGIPVLALTASPGGDPERIERIRTNLGLTAWVRIPEEATSPFRPPIDAERIAVPIPNALADILHGIEHVLERTTAALADRGYLNRAGGTPSPKDAAAAFARIRADGVRDLIPTAAATLQLVTALTFAASVDYAAACTRLEKAITKEHHGRLTKTARRLSATPEVQAAIAGLRVLVTAGTIHPKQEQLIATVRSLLADRRTSPRILVFHRFAEGTEDLARRLTVACGVRVERVLGRTHMRADRAHACIGEFRDGAFPILIATPVIREGIHIPALDALIEYSPPMNDIELIQLRGRVGRTTPGRLIAILAEHEVDRRYAFSASARANRMRALLRHTGAAPAVTPIPGVHIIVHRSAFSARRKKSPCDFRDQLQPGLVFERFEVRDGEIVEGRWRPYVRFTIGDRTGWLPLLHWCPRGRPQAEELLRAFPNGTIVIVAGIFTIERDERIVVDPQKDHRILPCPEDDFDRADYTPPPLPF